MRRLSQSDIHYRPYLDMLPWEDSVNQIYNTDPFYICYHEKTQSIRYTIPTLSTYVTMRRLSQSDIQHRPYLHMLPREDSVNPIYNTDPIYICYHEKTQSIRYTIPALSTYITHEKTQSIRYTIRPYLHMLPWEDSVDQIYNTDPIYIYYHEKTKVIRNTIPTLSTYVTLGWLSRSDIQHRLYLHMLPKEDSVNQIYNTDPIYICYPGMTQPIRCTIPTLSTYLTVRRLSRSDRQCWPYLHMSQCEDSVDLIYITDPI